jgi:hypothetical protein
MRLICTAVLAAAAGLTSASGAEAGGLWKLSYRMPEGSTHESTLDLQMAGDKVTGKITSKRGTAAIEDGRLEGNRIRFTIVRRGNGDELVVSFTGTVEAKSMNLKMEYRDHEPVAIVATRR